ncbi:9971_t:CDS:10 [Entrophospora sp. SA101]|nr:9971_t:CDS:10 [Entrophospora sp. SA101]
MLSEAELKKKEEEDFKLAVALSLDEVNKRKSQNFLSNKFSTQPSITASNKELPQKPAKKTGNTKRVKALYDFAPTEAGELGFVRGDVISVIDNDVYKDWWRGEIRGKTGIFPETLSEPTPDDIEKEAEVETLIFAQAQKIEILLEKLKRIDLQKKNAMEDEEIQELYSSMLPIRSKLVKVIEKYSQKKDQLISLHSKFIQSTKTYEKLMQESIQKYDYPSSISYSTKVAQNPNYNLISQQIPQDYHLLKQEASVLATFPQASSILYQQQQQSDMYNQSKFYNPQKIQYPLLPSQHLQNQQITYQSLPQEILNQQNLLHQQHTRATKYSSNQLNGYNVTPTIQQLSAQQPIQLQNFQQQLQQQLQQQALQPQQQTMQSQQLQQKTVQPQQQTLQPQQIQQELQQQTLQPQQQTLQPQQLQQKAVQHQQQTLQHQQIQQELQQQTLQPQQQVLQPQQLQQQLQQQPLQPQQLLQQQNYASDDITALTNASQQTQFSTQNTQPDNPKHNLNSKQQSQGSINSLQDSSNQLNNSFSQQQVQYLSNQTSQDYTNSADIYTLLRNPSQNLQDAATINQAQLTQLSIQYQDPKIFNNTSTTPSSVQHQNFIPYDSQFAVATPVEFVEAAKFAAEVVQFFVEVVGIAWFVAEVAKLVVAIAVEVVVENFVVV